MHRTVASANPSLRGRTSKVSIPLDNEGALNDLSASRTERPSVCTSIQEQYPPPTQAAETPLTSRHSEDSQGRRCVLRPDRTGGPPPITGRACVWPRWCCG